MTCYEVVNEIAKPELRDGKLVVADCFLDGAAFGCYTMCMWLPNSQLTT